MKNSIFCTKSHFPVELRPFWACFLRQIQFRKWPCVNTCFISSPTSIFLFFLFYFSERTKYILYILGTISCCFYLFLYFSLFFLSSIGLFLGLLCTLFTIFVLFLQLLLAIFLFYVFFIILLLLCIRLSLTLFSSSLFWHEKFDILYQISLSSWATTVLSLFFTSNPVSKMAMCQHLLYLFSYFDFFLFSVLFFRTH